MIITLMACSNEHRQINAKQATSQVSDQGRLAFTSTLFAIP
jgi:hypothetical protein